MSWIFSVGLIVSLLAIGISYFHFRLPKFHRVRFMYRVHEYDNCYSYVFEKGALHFEPGQYGHILPKALPSREFVREMSFASDPAESTFRITMHVDPRSEFKQAIHSLKEGDYISVFKIKGEFTLPPTTNTTATSGSDNSTRPLVFVAGGVGMTPFRSMILTAKRKNEYRDISLFQVQRGDNFLYARDLATNVHKYVPSFPEEMKAKLTALVQEIKKRDDNNNTTTTGNNSNNALFYVCGSQRFVNYALTVIRDTGVDSSQIKLESFNKKSRNKRTMKEEEEHD